MVAKTRTRKATRRYPHEMTPEEEAALRESEAQYYFGFSADEFARRWKAGEYEGVDNTGVVSLAMLFHFV